VRGGGRGSVAAHDSGSADPPWLVYGHDGGGKTYTFGDGRGPPVAVRFTSAKAQRTVILDPELRLGEAYMDGTFVVARGTIAEVLEILFGQELIAAPNWALARLLRYLFQRMQQFNPQFRARNNVVHQLYVTTAAGGRIVRRVPPTQGCRQERTANYQRSVGTR
jgi:hypothetical protein